MSEIPKFHSKMIKDGRWTVAIATGHGPASYVGDFATEAEAQHWRPVRKTGPSLRKSQSDLQTLGPLAKTGESPTGRCLLSSR
jgi:hypothetical protein